jgi:hypothetical protein
MFKSHFFFDSFFVKVKWLILGIEGLEPSRSKNQRIFNKFWALSLSKKKTLTKI